LAWYWAIGGHSAEGRATVRSILERGGMCITASQRLSMLALGAELASVDADWDSARSAYEEILALNGGDSMVRAGLALVRARQKDRVAARELAEEVLRLAVQPDDRRAAGRALRVLGDLATERGALFQAQSAYLSSLEVWHDLADAGELARTLEACAILAMARTHAARALRLVGAASALRYASGAVAGREAEKALGGWLELARTAVDEDSAAAFEAEGAQLTLEQAIELAKARIEPELTGVQQAATALHPLSERETQVAVLVARGRSNREIAAELQLSERTVEAHLRRILTRLGFATRTPLASWVVQQDGIRDWD